MYSGLRQAPPCDQCAGRLQTRPAKRAADAARDQPVTRMVGAVPALRTSSGSSPSSPTSLIKSARRGPELRIGNQATQEGRLYPPLR